MAGLLYHISVPSSGSELHVQAKQYEYSKEIDHYTTGTSVRLRRTLSILRHGAAMC